MTSSVSESAVAPRWIRYPVRSPWLGAVQDRTMDVSPLLSVSVASSSVGAVGGLFCTRRVASPVQGPLLYSSVSWLW